MKQKKVVLYVALFIFLLTSSFNVKAVKFSVPKGAVTVNNYSTFYSQIKGALSYKKTSLVLYVKKYNSNYDLKKSIIKADYELFNNNYYVKEWSYKSVTNKKDKLIYINFKYSNVDGCAKNYNEFLNLLKKSVEKKTENIKIKILSKDLETEQKKYKVIGDINRLIKEENKVENFKINAVILPNSNIKVYEYQFNYVKVSNINNEEIKKDDVKKEEVKNEDNTVLQSTPEEIDFYSLLKKSLYNFDETIRIKISKDSSIDKIRNMMDNIIETIEKITYDEGDVGLIEEINLRTDYDDFFNMYIVVNIKYIYPREILIYQYNEMNEKIKEILSKIIEPNMTEFQKELAIHDYLVNNTRYDKDNYYNGTIPKESFTAYGVLVKKVGVCQGYANAMKKLLNHANIDSIIVIGKALGEDHVWNLVKIDDNWYHVDVTWDDPIYYYDILRYDYFNLNDDEISKDHDWDRNKYPNCTDTKYTYYRY